jgi:hypothetical protein
MSSPDRASTEAAARIRAMSSPRLRRAFAIASVSGIAMVLAACGGSKPLPVGQGSALPTVTAEPSEPVSTEFPQVFDVAGSNGQDDEAGTDGAGDGSGDGSTDGATDGVTDDVGTTAPTADSTPAAGFESAGEWEDITSNLVGLPSSCGNLSYVSTQPGTDQVLAGVAVRGLWRLNDDDTWEQLGLGPGSAEIKNRTSWVEYDELEPLRFWESGAYGEGVFRTDDGGATFQRLGALMHNDYVSVDQTDIFRRTMLAGGHEQRALYRSVDGGTTWFDISASLPPGIGFTSYPVAIDSLNHVLGTFRGDNPGIFRSADGGLTWTTVHEGGISGPPLVAGDTIYWLRSGGAGIVVSHDAGKTFQPAAGRIGGNPKSLIMLDESRLVTVGEGSLLLSADEGATWTPFGPPLPYQPWGVTYSAERGAFYIWVFTCDFSGAGNPVQPGQILRYEAVADPAGSAG